jgi:hypothetical protein
MEQIGYKRGTAGWDVADSDQVCPAEFKLPNHQRIANQLLIREDTGFAQ